MSKPENEHQWHRRDILKIVPALVISTVACNYVGDTEEVESFPDIHPTWIFQGDIKISKDVNMRVNPSVQDVTRYQVFVTRENRPHPETKLIDWNKVKQINEEKYDGQKEFTIVNAEIVEGISPNLDLQRDWIRLKLKIGERNLFGFISLSEFTSHVVKPDPKGKLLKIESVEDGRIKTRTALFEPSQIGIIKYSH